MNKYGEIVRNTSPPPPISSYENHRNNNGNNTGGNGSIIAIAVGISILDHSTNYYHFPQTIFCERGNTDHFIGVSI